MGQPGRGISSAALLGVHLSLVEAHARMLRLVQENAVRGSNEFNIVTAMLNRGNSMVDDVRNASRLMDNGTEDMDEDMEIYTNGDEEKPSTVKTNGEVAERPKKVPKSRVKLAEPTATSDQAIEVDDSSPPPVAERQKKVPKSRVKSPEPTAASDRPYIKVEESSPPPRIQSPNVSTMKNSAPKDTSSPAAAFIASGLNALRKRDVGERSSEGVKAAPTKKVMTKKPTNELAPAIEFADISAEVDARLKAKELLRADAEAELQAHAQALRQGSPKKEEIVENKRKRAHEEAKEDEGDVKPARPAAATEDANPRPKRTRRAPVKYEGGSQESTTGSEGKKGAKSAPKGKAQPRLRITGPRATASASVSYTESSGQSGSRDSSLGGKQQQKALSKGKGKGRKRKAEESASDDDDGETITVRKESTVEGAQSAPKRRKNASKA
ncbi:MAG: hypothetical protein M1815_000784 [Lichina confinis]|nr:MAG: hypothetical protein M1815_000784 [Lichina confinis]